MKKRHIFVIVLFMIIIGSYYKFNVDNNYVAVDDSNSVSKIVLNKRSLQLQVGKTEKLSVTVTSSTASNEVVWVSNNKRVVTVSQDGTVSAVGVGKAFVLVLSRNNYSVRDVCSVVVTNTNSTTTTGSDNNTTTTTSTNVAVTNISLNSPSINLVKGKIGKINYTASPSNATNKKVSFSSGSPSIVKVNASGQISAVGVGKAVIYVTSVSNPNVKVSCTVVVSDIGKPSITLNKSNFSMVNGKSINLVAKINNASDKKVKWESSNTKIISVNQAGKIKALKEGSAVITAKLPSNASIKTSITVTVTDKYQIYFLPMAGEHGQSIVIKNGNNELSLYDAGWAKHDTNGVCSNIIKQLQNISGTSKPVIQHLFLSHSDGDHIDCYDEILAQTDVVNVYI